MYNPTDLPVYLKEDEEEYYHEELNQTLREWFNSSGFFMPTLTNAQVATLLALTPAPQPCLFWFNSDLGKMQLLVAPGTVQTVTSV